MAKSRKCLTVTDKRTANRHDITASKNYFTIIVMEDNFGNFDNLNLKFTPLSRKVHMKGRQRSELKI